MTDPSPSDPVQAVAPEMLAAYVAWEPPCEVDVSRPARALGLIRAAFFAGWQARTIPPTAASGELVKALRNFKVRFGGETEDEAKVRRNNAVTAAIAHITTLETTIARLSERAEFLPLMRAAFRTTTAGPGGCVMTFRFDNIEQLHRADDEWRALAELERTRP